MDNVQIESVEELESYFEKYQSGYLFRGQTTHYTDQNGLLNIPTSFSRHGCVPPLMFKWTHYAKSIIRAFTGLNYHDIDLELSQAILQHYGWRSFYVDLTKSPHVASWFASNKYEESRPIHMSENFDEDPVWLVHKEAKYTCSTNDGHIYVVDTLVLESLGVKIHDLTEMKSEEGLLRFHAQSACLAGNLKDRLPPESVILHLEVKNTVLVDFYKKNSASKTSDVFPERDRDYVLGMLLSLPWEKVPVEGPIPAYKRGLELPEFDAKFIKHLHPNITLFENFWFSENRSDFESTFNGTVFYKLPQFSYYANTSEIFELDSVNNILNEYGAFVIELDGLIKIIEDQTQYEYEKGIHVEKDKDGFVSVSGLVITHPGHVVSGVGLNTGWFYKIDSGIWSRVDHQCQCPCNNDLRHELQFSLLRMLNEALKEKELIKESNLCYRHKDIRSS